MKTPLKDALERLSRVVAARRQFSDSDLVPFDEEPEPCRTIVSPGGRWVLAPSRAAASAYRDAHPGEAVFEQEEVRRLEMDLLGMAAEARQRWLAGVIDVKQILPGATVEWVREVREPAKPPRSGLGTRPGQATGPHRAVRRP